jgi:twitching motility protein PilT
MSTVTPHSVSEWSARLVSSLSEQGVFSPAEGQSALEAAATSGRAVAAVLVEANLAEPALVLGELSRLSGVAVVDLEREQPSEEALGVVPEMLAREIRGVGLRLEENRLVLACAEPLPEHELRQLSEFLEKEVAALVLADALLLERLSNRVYGRQGALSKATPVVTGASSTPAGKSAVSFDVFDDDAPDITWVPPGRATGEVDLGDRRGALTLGEPPLPDKADLDALLTYAVANGASDLHISHMLPPTLRVDGALRPIEDMAPLDSEQIREMVYQVLTQSLRERFEAEKELDTSHVVFGVGRFRMNVFQQRGSVGAVFRVIPHEIPPFSSLGLPEVVASLAELRRGLVLVTGPTGSGKSTTLASLVDIINRTKPLHIMTIEDPIEFLHTPQRAVVNQRELGVDTASFSEALRRVLRQDPDVILVGEMRDVETISTALTAAETGHLVFGTLHTQDAPQTIDRIIDVFPTAQQDQVRIQLAGTLEAVVTQQLIISASGTGRVALAEVMMCTPAIRNLIRTAKTHQIYSLMQTGGTAGMQTMDQALARAVRAGRITEAVAFDRCHDPAELTNHLKA